MSIFSSPNAARASRLAPARAASKSSARSTTRIPRPPPPADALTSTASRPLPLLARAVPAPDRRRDIPAPEEHRRWRAAAWPRSSNPSPGWRRPAGRRRRFRALRTLRRSRGFRRGSRNRDGSHPLRRGAPRPGSPRHRDSSRGPGVDRSGAPRPPPRRAGRARRRRSTPRCTGCRAAVRSESPGHAISPRFAMSSLLNIRPSSLSAFRPAGRFRMVSVPAAGRPES